MPAKDFITEVFNRLLLLLQRHDPTAAIIRVGNKPTIDDTSLRGLRGKPQAGAPADFPQLIMRVKDGTDSAFAESETFGEESNDPAEWEQTITQNYEAEIIYDALNVNRNDPVELEVLIAWKAGRRQLKDPDTDDSELAYVLNWGPCASVRTEENIKGAMRAVTRITIPVKMQFIESQLVT